MLRLKNSVRQDLKERIKKAEKASYESFMARLVGKGYMVEVKFQV